jgi:hypothetical protein
VCLLFYWRPCRFGVRRKALSRATLLSSDWVARYLSLYEAGKPGFGPGFKQVKLGRGEAHL